MRLGILGGSFDPVHNGHLAVAHACLDGASLDEVWFLPASVQPLKSDGPNTSDEHRITMLRLATDGEPRFCVCTLEIDRGGVSYSVDTLRQLNEELPNDELFFILGADVVADVPHWKEPAEIFRRATPLVVTRAGEPRPDLSLLMKLSAREKAPRLVDMPPVDVSSSEIRARIAQGNPVSDSVPAPVAGYLQNERPYA
jgi:nicotinate-nucleotide adenylyltransferase